MCAGADADNWLADVRKASLGQGRRITGPEPLAPGSIACPSPARGSYSKVNAACGNGFPAHRHPSRRRRFGTAVAPHGQAGASATTTQRGPAGGSANRKRKSTHAHASRPQPANTAAPKQRRRTNRNYPAARHRRKRQQQGAGLAGLTLQLPLKMVPVET